MQKCDIYLFTVFQKGVAFMNLILTLADIICTTLLDPKVLDSARRRKGAFTRNCGLLPYWTVMKMLLSNVKKTIASSLDEFFTAIARIEHISPEDTPICSQQAFSKARGGVDHTIFQACFERVLDFLCDIKSHAFHHRLGGLWGIQIIAIDGSRLPLPARKVLLEKYGGTGSDASSPTAIASIAYDVFNDRILDALFEPLKTGERFLAQCHMDNIKAKNRADLLRTLFVFDRGYASEGLIRYITESLHSRFLFRLRSKFSNAIDALPVPSGKDEIIDQTVGLYEGINVRVIRFILDSGEVETLITNDCEHDKSLFKELYFYRWPVEGEYRLLKSKVGLTCFRGWAENSILQEFWIAMLLANLAGAIKQQTDGIIKHNSDATPNLKHKYKTNMNEVIGILSRYFPDYMDACSNSEKRGILHHIFGFLIRHKVRDKKGIGESNPRNEPRAVKHHINVKYTH